MEKVWSLFSSATKQNSYSSSYSIESASEQSLDPLFTLKKGKRNSDNLQVSVFEYKLSKDKSEENLRLAKLFLRRLKTLRHPNLLKFYDGEETDTLIAVCTEPVEPLHIFLESEAENLTSKQQEYQILWGLHQLLKAVHFLNSSSLAHCNVGLHSVYVDDAGDWKLGGLQYSRPLEELDDLNCLPNSHYLPPEIRKKKSFSSENPLWSVDVYSIGILIWEVFNNANHKGDLRSPQRDVKKIPASLRSVYLSLVHDDPQRRPNCAEVLSSLKSKGGAFDSDFFAVCLFLEEFHLKSEDEKMSFCAKLNTVLPQISLRSRHNKILPLLINAVLYGGARTYNMLKSLFKIASTLDEVEFQRRVAPYLSRLYSSPERETRVALLSNLELYRKHLSKDLLNLELFPKLAMGLKDNLAAMRLLTLKACLLLAALFTDKVHEELITKYLLPLQTDPHPGIRVNTVICMGKMAPFLSAQNRKKFLLTSLSRPLKDPFYHTRVAALRALYATSEYFDEEIVATKILPLVVVGCIDPEVEVRAQTFRLLSLYLSRLEKHSEAMPPSSREKSGSLKSSSEGSVASWTERAVSHAFSSIVRLAQGVQTEPPCQECSIRPTEEQSISTREVVEGWKDIELSDWEWDPEDNEGFAPVKSERRQSTKGHSRSPF